jgi:lysophospholipid acyltransferase (LPLAT)-like uncharacterized protein
MKIFKSIAFFLLVRLVYVVARSLYASYRFRIYNLANKEQGLKASAHNSICIAVWHENFLPMVSVHRGQKEFRPIISPSKDGDLIAYTCKKYGYSPIRGSSSRGGAAAKESLIDELKKGGWGAITIDGPRGPRRKIKRGVVDASKASQGSIVPAACAQDRYWQMHKSWDKGKYPKPFARIVVVYGEPITPQDLERLSFEEAAELLKTRLETSEAKAEELLKQWDSPPPTEPFVKA